MDKSTGRMGVLIAGLNGAVGSTVVAGLNLFRQNLGAKNGILTESGTYVDDNGKSVSFKDGLCLVELNDIVVSGWDINGASLFQQVLDHQVITNFRHLQALEESLAGIKPIEVASANHFAEGAANTIPTTSHAEALKITISQIKDFKARHKLERVVVVNLLPTEKIPDEDPCYHDEKAWQSALESGSQHITPAMLCFNAAIMSDCGFVNFTPSCAEIPVLVQMARERNICWAGKDGKTGQTFLKTVLAEGLSIRQLPVSSWYSHNHLGNGDGKTLREPERNRAKIQTKWGCLEEILGYVVGEKEYRENTHRVVIDYHKPAGDNKQAWDVVDIEGFLGEKLKLKIDFACRDSILAAPLIIDLVRLLEFSMRRDYCGVQKHLSLFFKAPHATGDCDQVIHALTRQYQLLIEFAKKAGVN